MQNKLNKTIIGLAILIATIALMQPATAASETIDTQTEWEQGTLDSLTATNGQLQLGATGTGNINATTLETQTTLSNVSGDWLFDADISEDGKHLVIVSASSATVQHYTLGTAWDLSTASLTDSLDVTTIGLSSDGLGAVYMSDDGTKLYIATESTYKVTQLSLGTAWDLSTASYVTAKEYSYSSNVYGLYLGDTGSKMYVTIDGSHVAQYSLGTGWDLSTATHDKDVALTENLAVSFNGDGTKAYDAGDTINQYSLGTAWDLGTATLQDNMTATDGSGSMAVEFNDAGTKMIEASYPMGNEVYQHSVGTTASNGNYVSQEFDFGETVSLDELSINTSLNNETIDYKVMATDGTGVEQDNITGTLADGSQTIDLQNLESTRYVQVELTLSTATSTSPKVDTYTVLTITADTQSTDASLFVTETISTTMTNVPVEFGDISPGNSDVPATSGAVNLTVENQTNIDVDIAMKAEDFNGPDNLKAGNMTYAAANNKSQALAATNNYLEEPFTEWTGLTERNTDYNRQAYFWLTIPETVESGDYSSTVSFKVHDATTAP